MTVNASTANITFDWENDEGEEMTSHYSLNLSSSTFGQIFRMVDAGLHVVSEHGSFEVDIKPFVSCCMDFVKKPNGEQVSIARQMSPFKDPYRMIGLVSHLMMIAANRFGAGETKLHIS
jgi:hypothetical protein